MRIPKLRQSPQQQQTISIFGGYDHNLRIPDGSFYEMQNMTSDHYPVLASRKQRRIVKTGELIEGITGHHGLCWVENGDLYTPDRIVTLGLEPGRKTLLSMGAYLIIMPDKKWVNMAALEMDQQEEVSGDVENLFESGSQPVELRFCDPDGSDRQETEVARQKPETPVDGQLWCDDSQYPAVLKRWSQELEQWLSEETSCIKLCAEDIGRGFYVGDSVQISLEDTETVLQPTGQILEKGEDFLVLRGYVYRSPHTVSGENVLKVSREMPEMDLVCECGNRLWGCKYGVTEKGFVNEIYCSKLGDFRNWHSFAGISTDSYVASVGVTGQFTGAVSYQGRPLFFKENCMIEVYGSYPGNYQLQTTPCDGVQKDCHRSLAVVNNVLYYKSRQGVCAFDGSMPVQKGLALGPVHYLYAAAGAWGNKYCLAGSENGKWSILLYDTLRGLWHRETVDSVADFAVWEESFYCLSGDGKTIWDLSGKDGRRTDAVDWMVETGPMGLIQPETRYVSRLSVRLWLEPGATATVSCRYDNDPQWEHLTTLQGSELGSICIPIRPRRCEYMRLKLEGQGAVQIYAITKTWEEGSDQL